MIGTGAVLGLAIAAPVGPIGFLCITRGLRDGFAASFLTGLGAATADASYGALVAFAWSLAAAWIDAAGMPLRLVGGCLLLWLGWRTWRQPTPANAAAPASGLVGLGAYLSGLMLTIVNPATMLSFAAAMAGLGPAIRQGAGFLLVLGVFLGSAAWWLALAGATGLARHRLPAGAIGWINRASALILCGFGLVALGLFVRALKHS